MMTLFKTLISPIQLIFTLSKENKRNIITYASIALASLVYGGLLGYLTFPVLEFLLGLLTDNEKGVQAISLFVSLIVFVTTTIFSEVYMLDKREELREEDM